MTVGQEGGLGGQHKHQQVPGKRRREVKRKGTHARKNLGDIKKTVFNLYLISEHQEVT